MKSISLRVDNESVEYLQSIQNKHGYPSLGAALKSLLKWNAQNDATLKSDLDKERKELREMIEHIHASIPPIVYKGHQTFLHASSEGKLLNNREGRKEVRSSCYEDVKKHCGVFQNYKYKNIKINRSVFSPPSELGYDYEHEHEHEYEYES